MVSAKKGRNHQTVREVIDFVLDCVLAGCTAGEAIAALELDGVLLDADVPTDKKEPMYSLCRRIVKTCEADPEIKAYYEKLYLGAKQAVEVVEGREAQRRKR